ncbi:hypothetical protein CXG81DRAFT_19433 [Caulochytrium protostelioides]|uniref:Uncharacterized protein n=1 Tax=Caulochytrium protostelioides TaxID=1555241 RepID=A0A4P9X6N2_9FUNG|nr:hypothetical protein CXG81DRAFT_19433 [Caulochytrium protostelioides]|eukprot:RKP00661.1 hypothetical protein CXG81DRAFT_19433 [Caulochytrium protostelioides]
MAMRTATLPGRIATPVSVKPSPAATLVGDPAESDGLITPVTLAKHGAIQPHPSNRRHGLRRVPSTDRTSVSISSANARASVAMTLKQLAPLLHQLPLGNAALFMELRQAGLSSASLFQLMGGDVVFMGELTAFILCCPRIKGAVTSVLDKARVQPSVVYLALYFACKWKQIRDIMPWPRRDRDAERSDRRGDSEKWHCWATCLILAGKTLEDRPLSCRRWTRLFGIPIHRIIKWEVKLCRDLQYDFCVTPLDWKLWLKHVGQFWDEHRSMWSDPRIEGPADRLRREAGPIDAARQLQHDIAWTRDASTPVQDPQRPHSRGSITDSALTSSVGSSTLLTPPPHDALHARHARHGHEHGADGLSDALRPGTYSFPENDAGLLRPSTSSSLSTEAVSHRTAPPSAAAAARVPVTKRLAQRTASVLSQLRRA